MLHTASALPKLPGRGCEVLLVKAVLVEKPNADLRLHGQGGRRAGRQLAARIGQGSEPCQVLPKRAVCGRGKAAVPIADLPLASTNMG